MAISNGVFMGCRTKDLKTTEVDTRVMHAHLNYISLLGKGTDFHLLDSFTMEDVHGKITIKFSLPCLLSLVRRNIHNTHRQ